LSQRTLRIVIAGGPTSSRLHDLTNSLTATFNGSLTRSRSGLIANLVGWVEHLRETHHRARRDRAGGLRRATCCAGGTGCGRALTHPTHQYACKFVRPASPAAQAGGDLAVDVDERAELFRAGVGQQRKRLVHHEQAEIGDVLANLAR